MKWLWIALGALALGWALWFLGKRLILFVKTGGRSACDNCPYSGSCSKGHCDMPGKGPQSRP